MKFATSGRRVGASEVISLCSTMVVVAFVAGQVVSEIEGQPANSEFQHAVEQTAMTGSGPGSLLLAVAACVFAAFVLSGVIASVGATTLVALDWWIEGTVLPLVDRLRPNDTSLGWHRRVDTYGYPTHSGQGVLKDLRALQQFRTLDDYECAHCGADLDVDQEAVEREDLILRRARRDWLAGPVVCRRDSTVNLYCDEDCEAGRLDPLLEVERTEDEEQEMTDPLGVLNRSD